MNMHQESPFIVIKNHRGRRPLSELHPNTLAQQGCEVIKQSLNLKRLPFDLQDRTWQFEDK